MIGAESRQLRTSQRADDTACQSGHIFGLHGSHLITELKKLDATAAIRCWGGDKMKEAGGDLVKHFRELAFMGLLS